MNNQQFYIDKYFVDVSRNQLVHNGQQFPLPPKAIAVLCLLAQRQGEVISFEEILATIWHDRVVSTNTLQRCISQIRQVFNDDSTKQTAIRTHARKGYSLELSVSPFMPETNSAPRTTSTIRKFPALFSALVLVLVGSLIYAFLLNNRPVQPYLHITPLTSSDAWESNGSYSPDGRFLLFQRHSDNCHSHLWIREINSQRESKLTARQGVFGKPSWSLDGNNITFVERNSCQLDKTADAYCWSVNTLNVIDAMQKAQEPVARFDCKTQPTWDAKWLTSGAISFVQETSSKQAKVKIYDPKTRTIDDLPHQRKIYYYSHDFAATNNYFALLGIDQNNHYWLDRFKPDGKKISSARLQLTGISGTPDKLAFNAAESFLMTEVNGKPFRLNFDGNLIEMEIARRNSLTEFSFAPHIPCLLATEIIADTDVLMIPGLVAATNQDTPEANTRPSEFKSDNLAQLTLSRSNKSDDNAKFQPSGSFIAFTSNRTGRRQIWTFDGSELNQISRISHGGLRKALVWSPNGKYIAGLVDGILAIWDLQGRELFRWENAIVENLFQWSSENKLLVALRSDGQSHLATLDLSSLNRNSQNLTSQKSVNLNKTDVLWASFTENGQLVYLDRNRQFWIQGNGEPEVIAPLVNQLEQPRAVMAGNTLYGINPQFQLWSYSVVSKEFRIIYQLPESLRYVSDFNGEYYLLTHMQHLNKDLVLLSPE